MATPAEIQAQLDSAATGRIANIIRSEKTAVSTIDNFYVQSGIGTGRPRWCTTTNTDSAATQAAAILTQMRT